MSKRRLPILSPPGLGINPLPNLANRGPTIIIDPLKLLPFNLKSSDCKYSILILSALKEYLFFSIFFTFTPRDLSKSINLSTSIISGILSMIISFSVNKHAHMT